MYVKCVELHKIRCFPGRTVFDLSKGINVLVGPTNSGKSTVLRAVLGLQEEGSLTTADITRGETNGHTILTLSLVQSKLMAFSQAKVFDELKEHDHTIRFGFDAPNSEVRSPSATLTTINRNQGITYKEVQEPNHFIVPLLANYRTGQFEEAINQSTAQRMQSSARTITAKIDQLFSLGGPKRDRFVGLCKELFGLEIGARVTSNGKQLGYFLPNEEWVPLQSMGDGVAAFAWFLYYLVSSTGKLFILEEPENSIHPRALKKLLPHIIESAKSNQFIVATHSAIVTNTLGAVENCKVFSMACDLRNGLHHCQVRECNTATERQDVLEDLGFELGDLGLWEGWLLLEESTAERYINEYLVPTFTPNLRLRLGTLSANGAHRIEHRFEALNSKFLFLHREPVYRERAWVITDGDEQGKKAIDTLKDKYKASWSDEHFIALSRSDIERFYPPRFDHEIQQVLSLQNDKEALAAKSELLIKVLDWARTEPNARGEIQESSAEIIGVLEAIEEKLIPKASD